MAIQYNLNKNEPYGKVIGDSITGARFTQNNIEFGVDGKRISKLTTEELDAEAAIKAANEVIENATRKKEEAMAAVVRSDRKDEAEIAKEVVSDVPDNMPDFSNSTKADMINHAFNVFGVSVSSNKTWQAIKDQVEGLY